MTTEDSERLLGIMEKRGAGWLASILRSMLGGDPWQEGAFARQILEEYEKNELVKR